MTTSLIMDAVALDRALTRMAHEIVEHNPQPDVLTFVGIRTHGAVLAHRLAVKAGKIFKRDFPVGDLDITMHRDDLALRESPPRVGASNIPFDVTDKTIVLVDDVLYTGRTIRAAMDELTDFGRPKCIQLACLIDRGHRELPIRPDYIGKNVPTAMNERVAVRLVETVGQDEVLIEKEQS